jgi:DeoR/GlpR family transcriptional regulator of sugar metabolism
LARTVDQSRRELIARAVRESGFVRNSELSSRLGVSTVTIRQDIDALSARGLVQKTYGGAVFNPESNLDSSFDQRSSLNAEAKRRIGRAAANAIAPAKRSSIRSTTIEIARQPGTATSPWSPAP